MRFELDVTPNLHWMAETGLPLVIADTHNSPDWDSPAVGLDPLQRRRTDLHQRQGDRLHHPGERAGECLYRRTGQAAGGLCRPGGGRDRERPPVRGRAIRPHERLRALSLRLVQVQESERRHLARELHDEIGQALTALKLSLETSTGELSNGRLEAGTEGQATEYGRRVGRRASRRPGRGATVQKRLKLARACR